MRLRRCCGLFSVLYPAFITAGYLPRQSFLGFWRSVEATGVAVLFLSPLMLAVILPQFARADTVADSVGQRYQSIELESFIQQNQLPEKMVANKQRLMLQPTPVRFSARLMSAPKFGRFSLVYDALSLWGEGEMPQIDHSAFIAAPTGRVIGVYLSSEAAEQLRPLAVGSDALFYAMHVYNYSGGPRLVVVGVAAPSDELTADGD